MMKYTGDGWNGKIAIEMGNRYRNGKEINILLKKWERLYTNDK